MWVDPIVEEVREHRRAIAEEAGSDLHSLFELMREWERQHPERMGSPGFPSQEARERAEREANARESA